MPYLQLDVPSRYSVEVKRRLAYRMGEIFANIMQTTPDGSRSRFVNWARAECGIVVVMSRSLARFWYATSAAAAPPEQRAKLAQALIDACVEDLGLRSERLAVEFTQHSGDEMFRASRGFAQEWTSAEANNAVGA